MQPLGSCELLWVAQVVECGSMRVHSPQASSVPLNSAQSASQASFNWCRVIEGLLSEEYWRHSEQLQALYQKKRLYVLLLITGSIICDICRAKQISIFLVGKTKIFVLDQVCFEIYARN